MVDSEGWQNAYAGAFFPGGQMLTDRAFGPAGTDAAEVPGFPPYPKPGGPV